FVWTNQGRDFVCIATGEVLEFVAGKLAGIANNAAFRAAERDVHDGALPGHPRSEGFDFVECNVGMIATAALTRSASAVVLHADAFEYANAAIVHFYRKG